MREKVEWASAHGLTPPEHARHMAADEEAAARTRESKVTAKSCCTKPHKGCAVSGHPIRRSGDKLLRGNESGSGCETASTKGPTTGKNKGPARPTQGIGWVAFVLAQKCHGEETVYLGLLNIGLSPTLPAPWKIEIVPIEIRDSFDVVPTPHATAPQLPPPRS